MEEVEVLLFITPSPLSPEEIARILKVEKEAVESAIEELKKKYTGPIVVEEIAGYYRLVPDEKYRWLYAKLGIVPEFNDKELKVIGMILKEGETPLSKLRKIYNRAAEVVDKLKRYGFVITRKEGKKVIVKKTKFMDAHFRILEG